jgi:ADP-ribosylglycohydrolase
MEVSISLAKAKQSLEGLSVGDSFGELFFRLSPYETTSAQLPSGIWRWTDDTHMALSIVEVLEKYGSIEQDFLAQAFARRFTNEPYRGYAGGAVRLLTQISTGGDWKELSPKLFGNGSFGNGSAMRVAPVGGYFFRNLQKAAEQARLSAVVTHAHIEGQAGAIAIAVAAALAANDSFPRGKEFLDEVLAFVPPDTITKERIELAKQISPDDLNMARQQLGTGDEVSAQDTVPFCLWCSAHNLDDFEKALWLTAKGFGDVDTTCAIVGSIVALSAQEIPALWLKHREPLPPA